MKTISIEAVQQAVKDAVTGITADYENAPDTDRGTLMDRIFEETDTMFGNLVKQGRIDSYGADDLIETAQPCAVIIQTAKADAWVEDDCGLWEGLTFGVLASVAFFSLHNLLYQAMADAGHDSNDDYPFAVDDEAEVVTGPK